MARWYEPDYKTNHISNHLLHELDIPSHNVVAVCDKADMWSPQVYACLRDESVMSLPSLERLGHALGLKLTWTKE